MLLGPHLLDDSLIWIDRGQAGGLIVGAGRRALDGSYIGSYTRSIERPLTLSGGKSSGSPGTCWGVTTRAAAEALNAYLDDDPDAVRSLSGLDGQTVAVRCRLAGEPPLTWIPLFESRPMCSNDDPVILTLRLVLIG